jgi:hypothetical protein
MTHLLGALVEKHSGAFFARCECGWGSGLHQTCKGWMPGARETDRGAAIADFEAHQVEAYR